MTENTLTEMEGGTLGAVYRLQPCTAYAVAHSFATSPSSFWSGSAGAVYPLMERLHKRGLLRQRAGATGKRKSKLYSLSKSGDAAFRAWLLDVESAANPGFDPLRTRLIALHAVSEAQQAKFLTAVEARIKSDGAEVLGDENETAVFKVIHKNWLKHRLSWAARLIRDVGKKSA